MTLMSDKKYHATVYFTIGWGLEIQRFGSDTYKGITEGIDKWVAERQGTEVKILGYTSHYHITKVVFEYPSGKKFVKKYD